MEVCESPSNPRGTGLNARADRSDAVSVVALVVVQAAIGEFNKLVSALKVLSYSQLPQRHSRSSGLARMRVRVRALTNASLK